MKMMTKSRFYVKKLLSIAPNLTKILHKAEKFMPFNLLKSESRYCNPFWNGSATKKIGLRKKAILRL